jgi:hypothetical protein
MSLRVADVERPDLARPRLELVLEPHDRKTV